VRLKVIFAVAQVINRLSNQYKVLLRFIVVKCLLPLQQATPIRIRIQRVLMNQICLQDTPGDEQCLVDIVNNPVLQVARLAKTVSALLANKHSLHLALVALIRK
jgi:hypothetical protein